VSHALAHIRNEAPPPELIGSVHVVDSESRLVDTLELSRLVLADPATLVKQIMDRRYVALSPWDDREKAVQLIQKFDLPSIPVVDERGVLLGVVTVDDVLDVAEEEATEDIQRQAAVAPLKAAYPQLGISALFLKRIPWVAGLMFVYMIASSIVSRFEETLAAQLVLASFIPLLMGSAGNVGSQAGTLTVRAIATGVLPRKLWMKAAAKETGVGASLAVTLGLLASLIAYVQAGPDVALVVGVAMAIVVIVANFFGLILPLILVSMGADPAVAASPFITSLTDITSLMIYFAVASSLLGVG
jgi:magnesium transporter